MCGINGGLAKERIFIENIENSLNKMAHRGPDDTRILQKDDAFLGIKRLAIIDLEKGQQPIYNEDKTIAVVLNGEIYNYIELTKVLKSKGHSFDSESDTEVLVHLYEEYGSGLCRHLRGMFAFAILDLRNKAIFIARDRFGKKPIYYTKTNQGGIIFASEIKALKCLMRDLDIEIKIREKGIYDYLSLSMVPQPETIFNNVFAIPPASWLMFDGKKIQQDSYWKIDYMPKIKIPYIEAKKEVRRLIAEAVQLRLRSDVPLGLFLSGGVDSSVIAYEAGRVLGDSLQTFTVSVKNSNLDESSMAKKTAELLGVRNTILELDYAPLEELENLVYQYDQPYADSSAIPSLAISRIARQYAKVILNGDGGDEIFAGYRRNVAAKYAPWFEWLPKSVVLGVQELINSFSKKRRSILGFATRFARGLFSGTGERYIMWYTDMLCEKDKSGIWLGGEQIETEKLIETEFNDELSSLDAQLDIDIKFNLLSDLLVKMDIATMAYSIEARSPLLDFKLAEFVARLPDNYRISCGRTKKLLRDAYRGALPDDVINGPKKGFEVPLEDWLKNELNPILRDTVGSDKARVHNFVDKKFIKQLLYDHTGFGQNWAAIVYSLLVLELWLRIN